MADCNTYRIRRKNLGCLTALMLLPSLIGVSLGAYLLSRALCITNSVKDLLVIGGLALWTAPWLLLLGFLCIQWRSVVSISHHGLEVRSYRNRYHIKWHDITMVQVRGDTNRFGLYRVAAFKSLHGAQFKTTEADVSGFVELLMAAKCRLDCDHSGGRLGINTARSIGVQPSYWDSVIMPEGLDVDDVEWIAISLHEHFPYVDPVEATDQDLTKWVQGLIRTPCKHSPCVGDMNTIRTEWSNVYSTRRHSLTQLCTVVL